MGLLMGGGFDGERFCFFGLGENIILLFSYAFRNVNPLSLLGFKGRRRFALISARRPGGQDRWGLEAVGV